MAEMETCRLKFEEEILIREIKEYSDHVERVRLILKIW
jgi:hypothetical protein